MAFSWLCDLQNDRSGHFPAADGGNQLIKAGYLSDVRKLVKQKADMNRQFAVVFVVRFVAKQIEKLRLQNSDNKIKGVVGIAHYEEKRGLSVAQCVKFQFIIGHEFAQFLNIKGGKPRTAGNKD